MTTTIRFGVTANGASVPRLVSSLRHDIGVVLRGRDFARTLEGFARPGDLTPQEAYMIWGELVAVEHGHSPGRIRSLAIHSRRVQLYARISNGIGI